MNLLRRMTPAAFFVASMAIAAACHHSPPPAPPPPLPQQVLSPPTLTPVPLSQMNPGVTDTAGEKHVDIDTHGAEVDVRTLLDFLAKEGNFTLVYSQGLNRKVRAQIVHAPISVALQALLDAAGLAIETTTPGAKLPTIPAVVFYELPVNVDSMSVDAIMKRFGVGRSVAEMIVRSRTNKP
jgi:hypothetical protein